MLTPERLAILIEILGEESLLAQEDTDPNDPDDVAFLGEVQDCFAGLRELDAWRQAYPGVTMGLVYATPYGVVGLQ